MTLKRSPSSFLALFGTATLVAGSALGINAGCISYPDNCTIILSRNTPGGTLGFLQATTTFRGPQDTTFGIVSTSVTETSTVNWMAIPKNIGFGASANFINDASMRRGPSGLQVQQGRTTLIAGTKTVTGVPFAAGALVFAMAADFAGTSGKLSVPSATVDSTLGQFVINSNQAADTSTVDWVVVSRLLRFSPSGRIFSQARGILEGTTPVSFSRMNPLNESNTVVLASVINAGGTPGNIGAPAASRITGTGAVTLVASTADTSVVELALF